MAGVGVCGVGVTLGPLLCIYALKVYLINSFLGPVASECGVWWACLNPLWMQTYGSIPPCVLFTRATELGGTRGVVNYYDVGLKWAHAVCNQAVVEERQVTITTWV